VADLGHRDAQLSVKSDELERKSRTEVQIHANQHWQNVFPLVESGDVIEISAAGQWKFGDRYEAVSPEGGKGGPSGYRIFREYPLGALVCGIEQGRLFNVPVPSRQLFVVPTGVRGSLDFTINDTDVGNNSGTIGVTVVRRRASP
jgi:PA-IL-like protein